MQKQKKFGLLLTTILALAFFSVFISAQAVTINSPTSNGNYSGTMNVDVTNDLINASTVSYNVTLYCNVSGGTVNSRTAAQKFVTIWNSTATATSFTNAAVSITGFTDSLASYNCSAYADNGTATTGQAFSVAVNGITIDNTAPTCDLRRVYGNQIGLQGIQEIIWSSSDAISLISTAVNLNSAGTATAYTDASRDLILQGSSLSTAGDYGVDLVTTDRAGNTCTPSAVNWTVYTPGTSGTSAAPSAPAGSFSLFGKGGIDFSNPQTRNTAIFIIVVIVVIAALVKKK